MPPTKMTPISAVSDLPRPHEAYKDELLRHILTMQPTSMLDVGCGEGALLRRVAAGGCPTVVGLEPDERVAREAASAGLDVRVGRGENLPFEDRSFEVVVLDYVAHHLENLPRALLEAARVASRAVLVLDCWYDDGLESQRVGRAYDDWLKRLDRAGGMVHNPCPTVAALTAPFLAVGGYDLDLRNRLKLQAVDVEGLAVKGRGRLAQAGSVGDHDALVRILDSARIHGVTDDGAILLIATRTPSA